MKPKYTVLDNGYILAEYEDGRVMTIPNDESNSDYQTYLTKDEVKADEAKTK